MLEEYKNNFIKTILSCTHDAAVVALCTLKSSTKHIYIFGGGAAGKLVKQNLEGFGVKIYRFVDNDKSKVGTSIEGIPVIGFEDLKKDNDKIIIIGTVEFHHEIVQQCLDAGISSTDLCLADFLHYDGENTAYNYFAQNIESILEIFKHCADQLSRDLFVQNLLYQINRDRRYYKGELSPLSTQYYDANIIKLGSDEVYFDCGAKDGDTAIKFHEVANGIYKRIVTFEPDSENFELLKKNTQQYSNIFNVNSGVGKCEEMLSFDGNRAGHSSFNDAGGLMANIVPLDKFIDEKPTFIKMDIEGFELNALMGAQNILKTLKPKLAICLYHKPCDIVELPKYILSQREDYKLFIRLYRDFGHDLVCYCI